MQKDVHFYLTYALARGAGIKATEAEQIAWANQFTDDLTKAKPYGIQTQVGGNWADHEIQLSVLIPFHFIPGGARRDAWPWAVTENSARARALVKAAVQREPALRLCALGVALHALQDTFSHQGFSGWRENRNSCGFWYMLPNVGHADMQHRPDVVDCAWTDPRTKKPIWNYWRVMRAARETFNILAAFNNLARGDRDTAWDGLKSEVDKILRDKSYDKRKRRLARLAGNPEIRYSRMTKSAQRNNGKAFARAAIKHLSDATDLFADLCG